MRTFGLRQAKELSQGHTAGKKQRGIALRSVFNQSCISSWADQGLGQGFALQVGSGVGGTGGSERGPA